MHSPSLHNQQLLDLPIGPLVMHVHDSDPNVKCRFDYDWLRVSMTLNGVPSIARHPLSSVEAMDFATFCAALSALVMGAAFATSHPFEAHLGIKIAQTSSTEFHVMVADGDGEEATAAASIQDVSGWIKGLAQILHVYPARSELSARGEHTLKNDDFHLGDAAFRRHSKGGSI